jgi:hypothetical protein
MRAPARRHTVSESGTRHELPDGGLCADGVREVLKLTANQTRVVARVRDQRAEGRDKSATDGLHSSFIGPDLTAALSTSHA